MPIQVKVFTRTVTAKGFGMDTNIDRYQFDTIEEAVKEAENQLHNPDILEIHIKGQASQ